MPVFQDEDTKGTFIYNNLLKILGLLTDLKVLNDCNLEALTAFDNYEDELSHMISYENSMDGEYLRNIMESHHEEAGDLEAMVGSGILEAMEEMWDFSIPAAH